MNAIPAESGVSASVVLHFICSAEKLPSIMKVRISWFLWNNYINQRGGNNAMATYDVYRSCQSTGRLIPGCGHAGQNIAMDPYLKGSFPCWCPSPLCILFCRSRHWRDACWSCLYRFCIGVSELEMKNMSTYIPRHGQETSDLLYVAALNSIAAL
jgi:hypothetical protein